MIKLTQTEVNAAYVEAKARYDALLDKDANLKFAYEFQGWAASMHGRGWTLDKVIMKSTELLWLFIKAQNVSDDT